MEEHKRPKLSIPYSRPEKFIEFISLMVVLLQIAISIKFWAKAPIEIPTHFGFSGQADNWGNKSILIMFPISTVLLYFLLTTLSRYPHTFNYIVPISEENAHIQYKNSRILINLIKLEICLVFSLIQWKLSAVALGHSRKFGLLFLPVFMLVIFGTIYYFIRRSIKMH